MKTEKKIRALLLASGVGSRLKPLTDEWPKCLMPIGKKPLLEYWLENLFSLNVQRVLVNLHHHSDIVKKFLNRPRFKSWVDSIYEENLLGTAGTLRANSNYFQNCTTLLIHADNWCQCNFSDFISYHNFDRNKETVMTMMTFQSQNPETCGIVETNDRGIVIAIHEKIKNPPGNNANGAVYLLELEVIEWIKNNPKISDFSTEVLPHFIGRIATWENTEIHKDIGAFSMLIKAQSDPRPPAFWNKMDAWQKDFINQPIHNAILKVDS